MKNNTKETFSADNPTKFVDNFDLTFRIKCETQLATAIKKLASAEKEVTDLKNTVAKIEGGITIFEHYMQEKYGLDANAQIDCDTGAVTYRSSID
jgi:hypothetical protein